MSQYSTFAKFSVLIFLFTLVAGCAKKPTLNDTSKSIAQQNRDIENCTNQAKIALEGAVGAAERDSRAAYAASSVSSATSGLTSGAGSIGGVSVSGSANRGVNNALTDYFTDRSDDPQFRKAVERCLRAKGYRVNGWN
ncbi:MAG: hypothetical protein KDD66_02580 [Bdellovibrionales bacterium]|nr:hypothetical protein [Bdellovibrionales bacterium]